MNLNGSHPVASVAARLCREHHGHEPSFEDVACWECWSEAIDNDKTVAAECELPSVCPQDTNLVDEVVVERACHGEDVDVTVAEWRYIDKVLVAKGLSRNQIYDRLRRVRIVDALGNAVATNTMRHYPKSMATDATAIHSRLDGTPIALTPAELRVAVRRLASEGLSVAEIARRLRIPAEQVRQIRASLPRYISPRAIYRPTDSATSVFEFAAAKAVA